MESVIKLLMEQHRYTQVGLVENFGIIRGGTYGRKRACFI